MPALMQVKPEEIGLSSARLTQVNRLGHRYLHAKQLIGAAAFVARRGKIAHISVYGKMDAEADKPMREDTLFRLYEMSQPILAVGLLMLYEQGCFQLSDPVSAFIPAFKELAVVDKNGGQNASASFEPGMTIKDLLRHTSGFINPSLDYSPLHAAYCSTLSTIQAEGDLPSFIQALSRLPLAYQPGSFWHAGISYDVIGYLIELFSELRLDEFIQKKITAPLNMLDTSFYVPKHKHNRLSAIYKQNPLSGDAESSFTPLEEAYTSRFLTLPSFLSGGEGLISSGPDYLRFCQMLLNQGELDGNRLLSRKTVELMTTNHLTKAFDSCHWNPSPSSSSLAGFGFGLGVSVMTDPAQAAILGTAGNYSRNGHAGTGFFVDPKEELIGVFLTQLISLSPTSFTQDFQVAVYQALLE